MRDRQRSKNPRAAVQSPPELSSAAR
jgi:hypothetical protein